MVLDVSFNSAVFKMNSVINFFVLFLRITSWHQGQMIQRSTSGI